MSLNEFFVFILESVYFIYCCSVTDTMISLVAHKLHQIPEQPGEIHGSIK